MKTFKRLRFTFLALAVVLVAISGVVVWLLGSALTQPFNQTVGKPPHDLEVTEVEFSSRSGSLIKGWFTKGTEGHGAVVLAHGVRANRSSLIGRARFLKNAGFSVLMFDFQAHGESAGSQVTFGFLESRDVQAAVEYLKATVPGERIGMIGLSMGGAAATLATPALEIDALVLEAVYPDIERAVSNRISSQLGSWSRLLTPLLTLQLRPRMGISVDDLKPVKQVRSLEFPKLFIAGEKDEYTTLDESKELYESSSGLKSIWIVPNAGHVDFHSTDKESYESKVLEFLETNLNKGN